MFSKCGRATFCRERDRPGADAYINEKRSDPGYASSFIPSPAKPRIRVTDQQALFGAEIGMVARGEIEIVDDRERSRH
jgi:hypothetical protein